MANELTKRGLFVSPTGVRSVWLRNDLQTFQRRLKKLLCISTSALRHGGAGDSKVADRASSR